MINDHLVRQYIKDSGVDPDSVRNDYTIKQKKNGEQITRWDLPIPEPSESDIESARIRVEERETERLSQKMRRKRNGILRSTDWTQLPDAPLSQQEKDYYRTKRQKLRDLPDQAGFPHSIKWP